jgi:hypothetical protein
MAPQGLGVSSVSSVLHTTNSSVCGGQQSYTTYHGESQVLLKQACLQLLCVIQSYPHLLSAKGVASGPVT